MDAVATAPRTAAYKLAQVIENERIAQATYRLRIGDPVIAAAIRPGQFVMVRPGSDGATDPLLGRPLALYDVSRDNSGRPVAVDVVYLVIGRGTTALSQRRPGDRLAVWGPLGNGFGQPPAGPVVFVAGGIGQTPFLSLGRWWLGQMSYGESGGAISDLARKDQNAAAPATSATLLYGARTAALLAGLDDFRGAGISVEVATDDGSAGHRGFVTELLSRRLEVGERPARIVACGPPAMLAAVARIAGDHRVPCEVSLENQMACGFGACFSCVAPIIQPDGTTDLRRVCVEGPVVSADRVDWLKLSH
jgi:dihydroorotate dehydrogenase electron transfer subunit